MSPEHSEIIRLLTAPHEGIAPEQADLMERAASLITAMDRQINDWANGIRDSLENQSNTRAEIDRLKRLLKVVSTREAELEKTLKIKHDQQLQQIGRDRQQDAKDHQRAIVALNKTIAHLKSQLEVQIPFEQESQFTPARMRMIDKALSSDQVGYGIERIAVERIRQINMLKFSVLHDDQYHEPGVLARAAFCYAINAATCLKENVVNTAIACHKPTSHWPFSQGWWKPKNPLRDLVKAGALIAAEIDKLERALAKRKTKPMNNRQRARALAAQTSRAA